ncbi:MAG: DUF2231 domain-containing protein [Acidimicrobiia bacterium]
MDIKTLFGLPAHPLLVHVPVILIPLALVGALGLWWQPWRDRFGIATAVVLMVAGIFTQLAISSGQTLRHTLDNDTALVRAHVQIAEDIRPWLLLFFIALVAFLWFERRQRAAGPVSMRNPVLAGTLAATIVLGVVSVYWVQRIGHTGAKAVWQPKMQQARVQDARNGGEGNERGG